MYQISGRMIEDIYNPGRTTTMLGMLKYPNDFQLAQELNQLWFKDNHTLTLSRISNGDAIFKAANATAGIVNLSKIALFMPDITPTIEEKNILYKDIESKMTLPAYFRSKHSETVAVPQTSSFNWRLSAQTDSERPRCIIAAFQSGKNLDQTTNPALFDHCNLKNMYATLNKDRYPAVDYNLSFPN
ncbi:uncharacterized protein LOC101236462 [Hydra vulgaris]|uniref:uncharacterized protein LOC101236462 n=1 Tax=Hydra vulgaris TaxID=6087 RepID=UPI001F5F7127|nr:uncharacterized protein LOC101236462 [Hydra vulgaris]